MQSWETYPFFSNLLENLCKKWTAEIQVIAKLKTQLLHSGIIDKKVKLLEVLLSSYSKRRDERL